MRNKRLILIVLLGFTLRVLLFIFFAPWNLDLNKDIIFFGDANGYHLLATCILKYFSFADNQLRTPVYPAFISLFYYIFGIKPYVVLFFQILINTSCILILYKICILLFDKKNIALISAFIFAIDPTQILFSSYLFSEALFLFFLLCLIYFLVRGSKNNKISNLVLSGSFLGVAILTRPIAQYFILPVVLICFLLIKENFLTKIKSSIIIIISCIIVVSPWLYRNYTKFGYAKISSSKDCNLLILTANYTASRGQHIHPDTAIAYFVNRIEKIAPPELKGKTPKNAGEIISTTDFKMSELYAKVANEYLKDHKKYLFIASAKGLINLHANMGTEAYMIRLHLPTKRWSIEEKTSLGPLDAAIKFFETKSLSEIIIGMVIISILGIIYLFSIAGILILIFKHKKLNIVLSLLLIIGYFVAASCIYPTPRFRMPIMPFYILFSSVGINFLINRYKLRT